MGIRIHAVGQRPSRGPIGLHQLPGKVPLVAEVVQQPAVCIAGKPVIAQEEADLPYQACGAVQTRIAGQRQQRLAGTVEHVAQLGIEQRLQFRGGGFGFRGFLRPAQQQPLLKRGIVLAILARHRGVGALVHHRLPGVRVHRARTGRQDGGLAAQYVADGLQIAPERHVLAADHLVQKTGLVQ